MFLQNQQNSGGNAIVVGGNSQTQGIMLSTQQEVVLVILFTPYKNYCYQAKRTAEHTRIRLLYRGR